MKIDGVTTKQVQRIRADHVKARGVPFPVNFRNTLLHKRMLNIAASQTSPCTYLGVSLNENGEEREGPFEPDPAKWLAAADSRPQQKDEKVWFEWLYVFTGSVDQRKPHRVSMLVSTASKLGTLETFKAAEEPRSAWG